MSKVVVFTNMTLDGVMQAPRRPDEDRRGGFEHGGWATPYAAMAQAGESMANTGALLLARRSLGIDSTHRMRNEVEWIRNKEAQTCVFLKISSRYVC